LIFDGWRLQGRIMTMCNSVNRCLMGLIFFPALLLQGCATSPNTGTAQLDQRFAATAADLEQKTDADSLAAAGLLRSSEPDLALDLLRHARAAAPERADLAWLEIEMCRRVPTCDSEPEEARLRALDASNGAGWLNALARAATAKNEPATRAALSALGHTARVDVYRTTLIAHLTPPIADGKKVPLRESLLVVIGILAADAIPVYHVTSGLCKGDSLSADMIADCRAVALAFERGDTDLTEMLGVTVAKRVWPADSAEWREASEARRVYEYRTA
jgi:hypothetical protein